MVLPALEGRSGLIKSKAGGKNAGCGTRRAPCQGMICGDVRELGEWSGEDIGGGGDEGVVGRL